MIIRDTISTDDYRAFGLLIREYVDWCRERYAHDRWFVDAAFGHQSLDAELQILFQTYGPPKGKTLLALEDGEVKGVCAYRQLSPQVCEMKRLFVPPRNQGNELVGYDVVYRCLRLGPLHQRHPGRSRSYNLHLSPYRL